MADFSVELKTMNTDLATWEDIIVAIRISPDIRSGSYTQIKTAYNIRSMNTKWKLSFSINFIMLRYLFAMQ
jgi:hypothetical protein